jgi:hypothetical protein
MQFRRYVDIARRPSPVTAATLKCGQIGPGGPPVAAAV